MVTMAAPGAPGATASVAVPLLLMLLRVFASAEANTALDSSTPHAPAAKLTVVIDHTKFHSWQRARASLSRFTDRSSAVSMVVKSPLKFKKRMGIRDPAEVATKRSRNASNHAHKKGVDAFYTLEDILPRDILI
jgi:hypothetical protein